jgi:hypothetical protein
MGGVVGFVRFCSFMEFTLVTPRAQGNRLLHAKIPLQGLNPWVLTPKTPQKSEIVFRERNRTVANH